MASTVIAAAVQVQVGTRVHILTRGSALPEGVSVEDVTRLERKGLIVSDSPEPKQAPKQAPKSASK